MKPRLAESSDALFAKVKELAGGVVCRENGSRLSYPTLRVVCGGDFRVRPDGSLEVVVCRTHGICVRDATDSEADEFHRDLDRDGVQVLVLTSPGFGSGYARQRVALELHSPSGLSFRGAQP